MSLWFVENNHLVIKDRIKGFEIDGVLTMLSFSYIMFVMHHGGVMIDCCYATMHHSRRVIDRCYTTKHHLINQVIDQSFALLHHGGAMIDCCYTTLHYSSRGGMIDPSSGGMHHFLEKK
uniref:tRNA (Guanine-N(7)-)-methyltransferase n=1 Tax=Jaagichlorella roystonensis TaxID=1052852 RepID=A0A6C0M5R0_9CHLO|nr:tRNA (guanine-N(7)-)-methyltransferase [Jaagichlorella roystonensis]YP_009733061.1 tRNA (guanine-N(7)-)-methyltransferase [Jaagichlorella roystonensis]QHU78312.1 tRNA (guanine-N(7)-)-methyltransferase [Jaagichlorella roystonensis]QHU78357.1 tRNA (guanine-N(7)-)-methyltransferase [Jaagichlorella roystonensis]